MIIILITLGSNCSGICSLSAGKAVYEEIVFLLLCRQRLVQLE